jgi:hypothetical protein
VNAVASGATAAWAGGLGRGLQAVALGAGLGGVVAAGSAFDLWPRIGAELRAAEISLTASIGPVWVAMLAVALRVGWLALRALATRFGHGRFAAPVRPELSQLAPLFAALGLCGTVWGLTRAFAALDQGEFLTQLPLLLGGLGAAMTSTLAGLGLQIGTLLLCAFNPAWSCARVTGRAGRTAFCLDGRELGDDEAGFGRLRDAIEARVPEALRVEFGAGVDTALRERVMSELWRRIDGAIPVRAAP